MKICIISPNYMENAWMVSAKKTAEALVKFSKQDVTVITSNVGGYPSYELINGVHVHRLKTKFIADPFNYAIVPGIFKWIVKHRNEFDIFIVNKYMFFTSLVTPILRLLKKKVIVQTDTFPGVNWKHPTSKLLNSFMWVYSRTIGKFILKSANKVVVLHEGNENICKKWKLDYAVIHNGVDYKQYVNAKPANDILLLKQPFESAKMVVCWVGRLDKIKGFQFFLDLTKEFGRPFGRVEYVMVCGDKYPELRNQLTVKYPLIHFYGFRKDIPEVYKASDVNILTSYDEGLPNTVMEAMAAGLPIITTNVGGIPSLVRHHVNGFIINHDVNSATEYLHKLFHEPNLRKEMGLASQRRIKDGFTLNVIANKWLKLINEVLK